MKRRLLALVLMALAAPLAAQQPAPPAPPAPRQPVPGGDSVSVLPDTNLGRPDTIIRARGDSIRPTPPVTPSGAFFRSLLIPGWGQAKLGRNVTGGLFVAFEGVAAAMVWKTYWQLDIARLRERNVASHTQEREDWIVLLAFNHLFAGAEAYVSAHLYDFPPALRIQVLPGPGSSHAIGVGLTLPLPPARP